MDKKQWGACVLALRAFYPTSFKLDEAAIGLWFEELKHLPGPVVEASIRHMARSKPAFPSLADILTHAEQENRPDFGGAWAEMLEKASRHGCLPTYSVHGVTSGVPEFDDPLLPELVRFLGGWERVCAMPTSEHATARAQFRDRYNELHASRSRDKTFGLALGPGHTQTPQIEAPGGRSVDSRRDS